MCEGEGGCLWCRVVAVGVVRVKEGEGAAGGLCAASELTHLISLTRVHSLDVTRVHSLEFTHLTSLDVTHSSSLTRAIMLSGPLAYLVRAGWGEGGIFGAPVLPSA